MSRLKMVSASCLSLIIAATFLISPFAHSDEKLKPLSVAPSETVASFVQHMFPGTEFLTGATLMALQNVPVVGAFAHDAGIYLLLGAAFDQGTDLANFVEKVGDVEPSTAHAASSTVLFLAGNWVYRDGAPVSALDWNSIFVRAASANEFSAAAKATIAENARSTSVKTAWNPSLQLWLANIAAIVATGPLAATKLQDGGFMAGVHRSAIITASYRTADLVGVSLQSTMGTSEPAATFFKTVTLSAAGWSLIEYARRTGGWAYVPDNSILNVAGEYLVESSFLGVAATIFPVLENRARHFVPSYPETAAFLASTALAGGAWAYAKKHPEYKVLVKAESGLRLGYIIFSLAPRLKSALTYGCVEFANRFGDDLSKFWNRLKTGKHNDEL